MDAARYRGAGTSLINAQPRVLALVALDTDTVRLFTMAEAQELAQQHSGRGMRQLYWRLKAAPAGPKSPRHEAQMAGYLLATKAAQLFPQ